MGERWMKVYKCSHCGAESMRHSPRLLWCSHCKRGVLWWQGKEVLKLSMREKFMRETAAEKNRTLDLILEGGGGC